MIYFAESGHVWTRDAEGEEKFFASPNDKDQAEKIAIAMNSHDHLIGLAHQIKAMNSVRGIQGCTYNDTNLDSVAAAQGYNDLLDHVKTLSYAVLQKIKEIN